MKEFDIYFANYTGSNTNCVYPNRLTVRTKADLMKAVARDYVCAEYKDDRRSKQNFAGSNVVAMDCDNEKTENPDEWLTPEKIQSICPNVMFYIHYSRNNNKDKGGLSARPRFHALFPIDKVTDSKEYERIKRQIASLIPAFDENAVDCARFFFGTKNPVVKCYNGNKLITDYIEPGDISAPASQTVKGKNKRCSNAPLLEGQRNNQLHLSACKLLTKYGDTDKARSEYRKQANNCVPPLPDSEIQTIWRSALQSYSARVQVNPQYIAPDEYNKKPPFVIEKNGSESINEGLLTKYFRDNNRLLIVQYSDSVFYYRYDENKGVYIRQSATDLFRAISNNINDYNPALLKNKTINDVVRNLKAETPIDENKINADENIINFENGILSLDTMELSPHSRDILSTFQLPCNWEGKTAPTPAFDSYIESLTNGDNDVKKMIMQFIGAVCSNLNGARIKKCLLLYGEGDTGKSQLIKLLEMIIGKDNYARISLSDFSEKFGIAEIYGKRLIGDSEIDIGAIRNITVFKSITGGDSISLEKKGKDRFTYLYKGFVIFCGNTLPHFYGDKGAHTYNRFMIVRCSNVIPENKRDITLIDKMYAEREGIIYKAIMAYKEMASNGYQFIYPEHCKNELQAFKRLNSPAIAFFDECCVMWNRSDIKSGDKANKRDNIFNVFEKWRKDNSPNKEIYSKQMFNDEIADYLDYRDKSKLQIHTNSGDYYPFRLRNDIAEKHSDINPDIYPETPTDSGEPEREALTPKDNDGFDWEDDF